MPFELLEPRQFMAAHFATIPRVLETDLVADGLGNAEQRDVNLRNPWGIAIGSEGNIWVADNATGLSTVYDQNGIAIPASDPLVVTIPPPSRSNDASTPTGTVFNSSQSFKITPPGASSARTAAPSVFLFATEDGTIAGWNPTVDPTNAVIAVDHSASGAIYKGLAMAGTGTHRKLFAANFHDGTIDVFNRKFQQISVKGHFTDRAIPVGFAPFNIQTIDDKLYVTYAKQDENAEDDVEGAGNGFVDVFNTRGQLKRRLASNGTLDSPWGLVKAPGSFGAFAGDILVGNFGDGRVNVFTKQGQFVAQLTDVNNDPVTITGLWSLTRGTDETGGTNTLFFSAGPNREQNGLFGTLTAR